MAIASQFRTDAEAMSLIESGMAWPSQVARKFRPPQHSEHNDLVSEGMQGLWEAAVGWHGDGIFEPFARVKIRWRVIDWINRHSVSPAAPLVDVATEEPEPVLLASVAYSQHLDDMMHELPRKMRDDFIMACRLHGVNHRQVEASELAVEMGITKSWVYKRVNRLFDYLRRHHPGLEVVLSGDN